MRKYIIGALVLLLVLAGVLVWIGLPKTQEPPKQKNVPPPPVHQPPPQTDYAAQIENAFANIQCDMQYGIVVFDEDYKAFSGEGQMPSASIIKLFIMEYAQSRVAAGEIKYTDLIENVPLRDHIERMIMISDNEATNILINHFGVEALNAYFAERGYADTKLNRLMLQTGEENYTSIKDVTTFFTRLYDTQETDMDSAFMLSVLKGQKVSTKIRKNLPQGTFIANKTGELATVENDAGIVFAEKGDFLVVFMTQNVTDNEATRNAIADATLAIYNQVTEKE